MRTYLKRQPSESSPIHCYTNTNIDIFRWDYANDRTEDSPQTRRAKPTKNKTKKIRYSAESGYWWHDFITS